MSNDINSHPFFGKFMLPPDNYENTIIKLTGSSIKNEEFSIKYMLKYFSHFLTEEELKKNMTRYNLHSMLDIVKKYFEKEYGYTGIEIKLNNSYKNTINSYIYNDEVNPTFIHIDELFESTVLGFLLAMFKWYKDFENLETYKACFGYILYLMNDVCIFGEMQDINANQTLMNAVNGDIQILQLAEDCYWTIAAFTLAHEIAHAYLASIGRKYTENHPEKEEYDADMIAYHIVLKIIEEKVANATLEEYTYLAPIMYMDFFDLFYYTDKILYKTVFYDVRHPIPKKRKNRLFSLAKNKMHLYDIRTSDGNNLYNCFLDVCKEFRIQLILKMDGRKLDNILRTEKRERMKSNRNNND